MTIDELSTRLREISNEAHMSPQGIAFIGHGQAADLVRMIDAIKEAYEQAKKPVMGGVRRREWRGYNGQHMLS